MRHLVLATVALAASLLSTSANAAYTITFNQVGNDVQSIGSGSIDFTGLTYYSQFAFTPYVSPSNPAAFTGDPGTAVAYRFGTSASSFGPGGTTFQSSGTGPVVGIFASPGLAIVLVPQYYVSGSLLSTSTGIFTNRTLSSLGLNVGTYVIPFGTQGDTFTVNVVANSVPEPASWAMMIGGFGLVGAARRRRLNAIRFA